MRSIDLISLNYLLAKETNLNFPLDCDVFEEVKDKLSKEQIKTVMIDLGKYLAQLHKIKGDRFGFVDASLLDNYELKGSHSTWYDFWADNFKTGFKEMEKVENEEKKTGKYRTDLSKSNRELMYELLGRKSEFLKILDANKELINSSDSHFLCGNVYAKNINLRNGRFVGLLDFNKSLLGDPVDELAYFSIMPGCSEYLEFILSGWTSIVNEKKLDEKLHLYRLVESYRKIITRYITHRYLDNYPEPLQIAQEELNYYNIK